MSGYSLLVNPNDECIHTFPCNAESEQSLFFFTSSASMDECSAKILYDSTAHGYSVKKQVNHVCYW